MAKPKPTIQIDSYGIYRNWDSESKELPRVSEFTTRVPAIVGIEFGFVVHIAKAKNQKLFYCIDHPGILDADGNRRAPFDGMVYVKTNDWQFYLGDTIWEPIQDKLGPWHMWLKMGDEVVAEKTFELFEE
ncbi:MAG: DUF3859 domain-containing protein [Planctomycetaceae bacterium]